MRTRHLLATLTGIGATVATLSIVHAADAQSSLAFEVASIQRKESPASGGSVRFLPGGRFERINGTASGLLEMAYPTTRGEILGAPEWIYRDRYDVIASAGREATRDEMALMMRALLEERFKLRAHVERQEHPIFSLVVARDDGRLGPDLKRANYVCQTEGAPPCGMSASAQRVRAVGVPLSRLADLIWVSAGRLVEDRTGLPGIYEFTLVYKPANARPRPADSPPDDRPDLVTALREQLGLRLEPARGLVDVLVVDHVERPTEN